METLEIRGNPGDKPPRSGISQEHKIYQATAAAMEIGQHVETVDKKTTAGLMRALERIGRHGKQRTLNGSIHVWRDL